MTKRFWANQAFFVFLFCSLYAWAQSDRTAITNADVVEMVKAGLGDDTIVLAIQTRTTSFDTGPATLVSLKKLGVSDKVLAAMLNATRQPSAQTSQTQPQVFDISIGRYFCKSDTPARLTIQQGRLLVDTDKGRRLDLSLSQIKEVVIGYSPGSSDPGGCPGHPRKWGAVITWIDGHKKKSESFNASSPSAAESLVNAIACGADVPITGIGPNGKTSSECGRPFVQLAQSGPILKIPPAVLFHGGTSGSETGSSHEGRASPDAIAAAKRDVRANPNDPTFLNDAGCILQSSDEKQACLDLLTKAHQLAPEEPIISYNYARCLYGQGRVEEATQQAQAALQRKPDLDEAHILLSDMATQKKNYDAADQELKNLANVVKEIKVAALTIQAAILMGKGKLQQAYQMFQQALSLDQQDPTSLYNAGLGSQMLGNFPQAQNYYQQALQLDPNMAEAHNNLGMVLMELGQLQQALQQLQAAARTDPANTTFASNLNALQQPGPATASDTAPSGAAPPATTPVPAPPRSSTGTSSAPVSTSTGASPTDGRAPGNPGVGDNGRDSPDKHSMILGTWTWSRKFCGLDASSTMRLFANADALTGTLTMRTFKTVNEANVDPCKHSVDPEPWQTYTLQSVGFDGRTLWFTVNIPDLQLSKKIQGRFLGDRIVIGTGGEAAVYQKSR